ncbi:MAG TPA: MurR/RpiR family transcriptional regulator [Lachnoclostridium sp.]|nr:MurR/RpiR family transcriptional regulator [Lachnoclostridium sp.]
MYYGKLPILLLAQVSSSSPNSTNSQIASYILNHLEEVRDTSIKDLASKCFVSLSSISRFCRDMGLNDFAELRELITETDLKFEIASDSAEPETQKREYLSQVRSSIRLVEESLDMSRVEQLVDDIAKYDKVSVFGILKGETAAMNLQTSLLMLGKLTHTQVHFSKQIEYLEQADEKDLIIIFSYTGIYFDYEYPKGRIHPNIRRPKIWFITGAPNIRKSPWLNEVIHFASRQNQPSHPYQLQAVADVIAQSYAHRFLRPEES